MCTKSKRLCQKNLEKNGWDLTIKSKESYANLNVRVLNVNDRVKKYLKKLFRFDYHNLKNYWNIKDDVGKNSQI